VMDGRENSDNCKMRQIVIYSMLYWYSVHVVVLIITLGLFVIMCNCAFY